MAIGGLPVSSPGSEGSERPVADMLLIYSDRAFQPDAFALPFRDSRRRKCGPGRRRGAAVAASLNPAHASAVLSRLKCRTTAKLIPGYLACGDHLAGAGQTGGVGFVNQEGLFDHR